MDIRMLKYFLAIIEEGSISKAAEKLHIAQPPLSQQLKLLEEELGAVLIERSTRKFEVTDVGRRLGERAKQILELMDTTIREVKDISQGLQGTLSIGTVSSAGAAFLPERINSFRKKYPGVNFEIIDEDTTRIIELLKSKVIDIGIIRTPFNSELFEAIVLPEEPMSVASTDIAWDGSQKQIYIENLKDKPLIVPYRYERTIQELCHERGFQPQILCKSNDVRTMLLWANAGLGYAIVPRNCSELIPSTGLKFVELKEAALNSGTAIIWSKEHYLSSAARHFLESFEE